jgi:hypothetical protein
VHFSCFANPVFAQWVCGFVDGNLCFVLLVVGGQISIDVFPVGWQGCQLSRFRRKLPDFYAHFRVYDFFFKLRFFKKSDIKFFSIAL